MKHTLQDFIHIIKINDINFTTIIEVGSRDGKDADELKKAFDINNINVHIIEPNPICVENIKKDYHNYNTHEVAFSDRNGIAEFNQINTDDVEINGVSSLLYREKYELPFLNLNKIIVKTQTAADFFNKHSIKDCIVKIDVEGFTYQVLHGFGEHLKKVKALHIETEGEIVWENQKTSHDVFHLLNNNFILVMKKRVSEEHHYLQYDEIWVNRNCFKYTLDNYFDKIFYINLNKDVERKNKILEQFKKYNICNFERISATEIRDIPERKFWRNFNVELLNEKYILGSLGTRNSHWRIMELSLQRGYDRVLIFEDDIIIKDDPNELLKQNADILNMWDMLYFGGIEESHFRGQIVHAHAYAVSSHIIRESYFMLPTSGMEVDNFYAKVLFHMSFNYSPTGKYLIHKMYPFNTIVQNNNYPSNIKP